MPRYVDRVRYAWDRFWQDRWFDWIRDVDTSTGGGAGNGNMPAFTSDVRWAHAWLLARVPEADWPWVTFVDIGCGKGKAMLVWAEENKKRHLTQQVVGLESDEATGWQARANIERSNHAAHVMLQDASRFSYPLLDRRLIVWFFNPFGADLMPSMLAQLEECREVWFVYGNPKHAEMMLDRGWVLESLRVGYHERNTLAILRWPA